MNLIASLFSGILFGLGLVVSDMIDPARVIAFLDVASGAWDPTLAFVMAGAVAPMIVAWRVAAKRAKPVCGEKFPGPAMGAVNRKLIVGAATFGTGWGLVGICPGPAIAALSIGGLPVLLFVACMFAGFFAASLTARWL